MNSVLKNISVFAAAVLFSVPVQTYFGLGAYTEFHDLDAPRLVIMPAYCLKMRRTCFLTV